MEGFNVSLKHSIEGRASRLAPSAGAALQTRGGKLPCSPGIASPVLWSARNAAPGKTMNLTSTLTCPQCGHRAAEVMPTDACQYFYQCKACGAMLKPLPGDCCVFCSYGDVPCPPVQAARLAGENPDCCGGGKVHDE